MTIYKQHTRPDGSVRRCDAGKKPCRYGVDENHHYYDTSIKKDVLKPGSPLQKKLNELKPEELKDFTADKSDEHTTYYKAFQDSSAKYEKEKERIVASYPVPEQGFVKQLLDNPSSETVLGTFEINGVTPTPETPATEKDRLAIAEAYHDKVKTESKYRAYVSSTFV
jgi:hypothetical protein